MKNKGFTLIELLGVIIILSLLTLIVLPNVVNSARNSSSKTDTLTLKMIYDASDIYISNHTDDFPQVSGNKFQILLTDLINENLLSSPIRISNADITNIKCVQVEYNTQFNYELKNIGECKILYDKVCTLEDGTSQTVGSKYTCTVMDNVYFYVLENNELSNNISLIMDRNYTDGDGINGTVPPTTTWCTSGINNKTCVNINEIYATRIQNKFNTMGVTVSFPTVEQISSADNKNYLDYPTIEQQWLYGNLNSDSIPYGYWTASYYAENSTDAWIVGYNGRVNSELIGTLNVLGVRPVITIPKYRLD